MKNLVKALGSSIVEGADSKRVLAIVALIVVGLVCQKMGVDPPAWLVDNLKWALPAWIVGESYTSAKKAGGAKPPVEG